MSAGMPQFDFAFYVPQIFWLLVVFFGFFLISRFFVIPRVEKIYSERNKKLSESELKVKSVREELYRLKEERERVLSSAQMKAKEKISKVMHDEKIAYRELNSNLSNEFKSKIAQMDKIAIGSEEISSVSKEEISSYLLSKYKNLFFETKKRAKR